jgi:biopolymer transport protein ExbD
MVRKRLRSAPLICTIDVSGFAAVMLALLAMFMAPVMFVDVLNGPPVSLPKAQNAVLMPHAHREDAMVIGIARDGEVYFGSGRVRIEELPAIIGESLAGGAERKVYMNVDRLAEYKVVASVLDEVRSAGVENIGFLVAYTPPHD